MHCQFLSHLNGICNLTSAKLNCVCNCLNIFSDNNKRSLVNCKTRLFKAHAKGSALESIALKAATVMLLLLLQMTYRNTKSDTEKTIGQEVPKKWVIFTATQTTQQMGHFTLIAGRAELTINLTVKTDKPYGYNNPLVMRSSDPKQW